MSVAVLLIDPKYPHNVGQVLRACAAYNVPSLLFTGQHMQDNLRALKCLPREERLRGYQTISLTHAERPFDLLPELTPVAVEVRRNSESLPMFEHRKNAVYVFGPEDGSIGSGVLSQCHRFVAIPSVHCLNLSMAVGTVLYDRQSKLDPSHPLDMTSVDNPGYFEVRDFLRPSNPD